MLILIIGGSGSGKSRYAEHLAHSLAGRAPKFYLATMQIWDAECRARAERHRIQRSGLGFTTIECPRNLSGLNDALLDKSGTILLEDLGNLTANELYAPDADWQKAEQSILAGIRTLHQASRNLVIVSNEVGTGGTDYAGETLRYLRLLGRLHQRFAEQADAVCEVVGGLPVYYKGRDCL